MIILPLVSLCTLRLLSKSLRGAGSIGIPWDEWTEESGLHTSDGAVFWMDPGNGPSGTVVVAQLTMPVAKGSKGRPQRAAMLGVQGRSGPRAEDWRQDSVTWHLP